MQALTIGFPTVCLQCLKAALLGAATPSDATNTGTNIPNANATIFFGVHRDLPNARVMQ
jgi:hypothetical protein